jgi:hypothetical protein
MPLYKALIMAPGENYAHSNFLLESTESVQKSYFTPSYSSISSILNNNITNITPNHPNSIRNEDLIEHGYLDILGSTTNTLIYCLLDNSPNDEFTRLSIRESIEKHVEALKQNKEKDTQHITRIQTGKAAVNYWIDRMVENGTFDKKHTKPVKFWIKKRSNYQRNVIHHKIPINTMKNLRGLF